MSEPDFKAKCEELSAKNVELTAQVKSLEAVASKLQQEVQKWKAEFDNTVAIHNRVRDEQTVMLSNLLGLTSNTMFLASAQLEQHRAQAKIKSRQLAPGEMLREGPLPSTIKHAEPISPKDLKPSE